MRICGKCWKISKGLRGDCYYCGSEHCFGKDQYPADQNADYLSNLTLERTTNLSIQLGTCMKYASTRMRQFKVLFLE